MNLSTARSERAREWAQKWRAQMCSLIVQFISESTVMAFIAFVFALVLVQVSLGVQPHR